VLKSGPAENPICYLQPRRRVLSAWIEHVPFGMYMIDLLRPASIVELGTRNGVSYSAFCQAVLRLGIEAHCVAVDSWHGDAHTGSYGPTVLQDLRRHHDPLYGGFSRLLQTTFDEAAATIPDGSVDLLHIDGFHRYEASRHDFETWLPKLSRRGVVMLHDVSERGRDFGVWKFWEEISHRHPSFAFRHGHGLGIVGVGTDVPTSVRAFLDMPEHEASGVRRFFHQQGRRVAAGVTVDVAIRLPLRLVAAIASSLRGPALDTARGG
jgi:hypothetical protein